MTDTEIFSYLPRLFPQGRITVEEDHTYIVLQYDNNTEHARERYILDKSPFDEVRSVVGVLNGVEHEFVKGTDYAVIDDDGDEHIDSIDWSVGGDSPDDNTTFTVTYITDSIISRYVGAHQTDVDDISDDIDQAESDSYVDSATGVSLDQIGAIFGEIGKRRGRNDDEYRAFLKSIVQSFSGRGTLPGLKFAVAAGVGTSTDNITINEDFSQTGYTIQIDNVDTDFITSVVSDMAELADPSGVELLSDPVITIDGDTIPIVTNQESTVTSTQNGLGSGTLTLDGNSTLQ